MDEYERVFVWRHISIAKVISQIFPHEEADVHKFACETAAVH